MASSEEQILGTVGALWRYPVKSMLGEELEAAEVTERGVLGDRGYACVDLFSGNVASAKYPRKWARLFECQASYVRPPRLNQPLPAVDIILPDGTYVTSTQDSLTELLSGALGRDVVLMATPPPEASLEEEWADIEGMPYRGVVTEQALGGNTMPGLFFDGAVIHLLATATLKRLQALYPAGQFAAQRFRPNIVVQSADDDEGFTESAWLDHTLALGDDVRLEVIGPCVRCVMTTLAQGDLPADPGILRAVAQHNRVSIPGYGALPSVGVYASVARGGTVLRGDSVRFA
ncbi:MAG TPA: MOSC N-terminal beta barrel domain-containing protein [Ktedonobacterales bacterium]|nr:MOSC N-terminal beta barrel domain-containing protein [Ktedonobacterales bacterium]